MQKNNGTTGRYESATDFLAGGGELGALMRAHDWSATPLGAPEDWPQSLKIAVRVMLTSRQPIWIGWGDALTYLYNDPYKSIIGGKHPWALGKPTSAVWSEIWSDIGPMLDTALGGVEGTYVEEQLLIMERNGYPEETYYTFSYSPIPDDSGIAGGIICANTDDTKRVFGERQLALLRDLAARTADARNWRDACERSAEMLASNPRDLPFALIYLAEPDGKTATRAARCGIPADHPAAPLSVAIDRASPWPLADVLRRHEINLVPDLQSLGIDIASSAWNQPPRRAVVIPISAAGETGRPGALIVGLNPYRLFDDSYRDFLGLVAGQISAAIANAETYESERRRVEKLAELDRDKTQFFSNVSHEFRTPLTLMLGPLEELLADTARLPAPDRAQIEVAHRNGLRLLKLVNSLLEFSRIEAGRAQARFQPTDLAALTAELASNFRSATDKAGLELVVDCPPLPEPVYVDREMWEKIVLNLLSNAFKFTFDGSITTQIKPVPGAVELTVRDTGTGIAAHELPRLFERFHRIEGARGRSFEGSGIGLALVHELVKLHGGSIRVESEDGRGSAFIVALPLGSAHLPAERIAEERGLASTAVRAHAYVEEALRWLPGIAPGEETVEKDFAAPAPDIKGERASILLAEDNADMRDYVRRLFGVRHEVEAVADGKAALDVLRLRRPDLVLTDIMMPRLDGFGLLRAIREDPELRDLPVIVLSARAGADASIEGLAAGADDYLAKPFSARELIARVDSALAMARMRRQVSEMLREREEAQRQLNEVLERRVAQAIQEREQAEQQLRQSQKMEAVGKLTGGVAHDFNNLLQVIGGNLQILARDVAGNERAEQRLRNALSGVSRGAKLASQLLAFGRRQPLAPKVVNLGRLVRGLDDMFRRALGDGIETETVIAAGLWNTLVDPSQVESALLNLAINARDAMNRHGKLTVEAGNASLDDAYAAHHNVSPGQYVMLAVTDTGCGMTPDVMDRVFEPFFTTKPEGQGTGLGLSMVYGFVKQSDGHIKIYSEPGQGTTIRIYLPRVLRDEDVATDVSPGPVTGGTETVLVVEDDEDVRLTAVEMLSDLGYRVLKARDAQSAFAIVESGVPIDLLFTDVVMPGPMRSPELARKAKERLPNIAVLFTSGYTDNAIVHGGRLDDGIELLSKPYTREALARKIRHVLRNHHQRNPRLAPAAHLPLDAEPVASGQRPEPLRVLLVEDDALIRLTTADMLTSLGHAVFEAGTARDALVIIEEQPVDVLLTDIGLPGISGVDLASEARRKKPDMKVVFATGNDSVPGIREREELASAVLLQKPYDQNGLARALASADEAQGA
ncbi:MULTISPECIES: response regulator [Rhodomicrobium]|uniref:response regulator n=1 Tax=Rhodomicrobium vannielii TaxID=1069 RepID=UPI000B4BCF37